MQKDILCGTKGILILSGNYDNTTPMVTTPVIEFSNARTLYYMASCASSTGTISMSVRTYVLDSYNNPYLFNTTTLLSGVTNSISVSANTPACLGYMTITFGGTGSYTGAKFSVVGKT